MQLQRHPKPLPSGSRYLEGGFFADQNKFSIAQHASDYSLVTPANPARAGETIIVYANGFFAVWPYPPIGFATPSQPLFRPYLPYPGTTGYLFLQDPPVTVDAMLGSCANTPALNVTFEGLAPRLVGVEQINFVVRTGLTPGNYALFFSYGTDVNGKCNLVGGASNESSAYVMIPVG